MTRMKQSRHTITERVDPEVRSRIPAQLQSHAGLAITVILVCLNILAIQARAHEGMEHIAGTVLSIGDNILRVKTTKGTTVEVHVDAKTEYAQGKQRAQLSDLKTGNRVVIH